MRPAACRSPRVRAVALTAAALLAPLAAARWIDYSLLPPANASELVGQEWQGPSAFEFHCEQCSIAFQPFDSFQKLQCSPDGNCSLLPTAPGDYVVYGEAGFQTMRSMPAADQWPLLFEDGFQGCPIVDTCSDRFENVYTPLVSVGSCTLNRNAKFVATAPTGGNTSNACGLVTSRPAFSFFAEPARHAWANVSVNATGAAAPGAMRAALLGLAAGMGPEAVADTLLASGPQQAQAGRPGQPARRAGGGASPVAAVGLDLAVSDAGGSVQLWARTSAAAPLRTLHTWQLPAACVADRVAALDSLALSLDWTTATVELACGGRALPPFSGASGLVWSEWGPALATSRVAMAAVSFAEKSAVARDGQEPAPVSIQIDHWAATTLLPRGVLPAALGPFPGGALVDEQLPSLGGAHEENERLRGVLDVTLPPFSADPTGKRDATLALNLAVAWARDHSLVPYLPIGNYSVSSTLELLQFGRILPGTTVDAAGALSAPVPGGAAPASLRGQVDPSRPGARAAIVLSPRSPGFGDPAAPRAVLNVSFAGAGGEDGRRTRNQVVSSLRVVIGAGNPGAVGVRLLGGAGSGLEDVSVVAGDGLIGVSGLSGEGGATAGLTVEGGAWGLDARGALSQSTVSGLLLAGQRCGAAIVNGPQSTTIVGAAVTRSADSDGAREGIPAVTQGCSPAAAARSMGGGQGGLLESQRGASSTLCPDPVGFDRCDDEAPAFGQLAVVDSRLDIGAATRGLRGAPQAPAVWTRRSVVLSGVWVRGEGPALVASTQAANASHPLQWSLPAATAADKWLVADRVAVPVEPPAATWGSGPSAQAWQPLPARLIFTDAAWNESWRPLAETSDNGGPPPAALVSRHGWGGAAAFPSFEWPGAVLAKQAGRSGRPAAAGDGASDDSAALQAAIDEACPAGGAGSGVVVLGRGVFALSQELVLPGGCALLGAAAFSTQLVALPSASPGPDWLVTATAGVRAAGPQQQGSLPATVAMLQMRVWASGGDSTAALRVDMGAAGARAGSPEAPAAGFQTRQAGAEIQPLCGRGGAVVSLPGGRVCPPSRPSSRALVQLQGGSGGDRGGGGGDSAWQARLFTVGLSAGGEAQGPDFRGLLVSGMAPSSSLAIYHTHVEGLVSDAGVEARASRGAVDVYGLAASGRFAALLVSAPPVGSRFALWGFGGSACPLARNESYPPGFSQATPSLFRIAHQTSAGQGGAVSLYATMDAGSATTVAPAGSDDGPACPRPDAVSTVVAVRPGAMDIVSGPAFRPSLAEF